MPAVPLHVRGGPADVLAEGFDAIRAELGVVEEFTTEVLAEVDEVVRRGPSPSTPATADLLDVPFLTIDPPGSMDLDQALALERDGSGYVFRYAIADVAAFVAPGGAIDAEARRRVVTVYLPDRNAPLHPRPLSEGAASLLPEVDRQAVVWTIRLDEAAEPVDARVERARVRSRRRLTYAEAQSLVDGGTEEALTLLREIGERRQASEIARGGVSLPIPDQQVVREADGRYRLEFRAPLPAEGWNAQLSLLAGMAAAELMLAGGVGVLRTLPPPSDDTVRTFRRRAAPLGVTWSEGATYGDLIRSLDADVAAHAALLTQAARLFRGAGYVGFDGAPPAGDAGHHAAVAAPYAHVTAPLRRLVDRFGNEIVLAQCAGTEPPSWAREALDELPALMDEGRRREGAATGMALDLVEAAVLAGCEGEELRGVVTATSKGRANVQIVEPAVLASVDDPGGALVPGREVGLRVAGADVVARRIHLEVAGPPEPAPTRPVTGRP